METKRNDYLVSKKFYRYLIPSFLSELAMHMGTVIDAVIVGNLIGTEALSAVTLSGPVIAILFIPGLILGLGGATLSAVYLGERKIREASNIFSACVVVGVIFSTIAGLSAFWISEPLSRLLADDPTLAPLVDQYLFVHILGLPVFSLALLTCEFLSVDNNPDLGAWMFGIAAGMNVVLDIVLIKFLGFGIDGAALASTVGYGCSLVTLLFYARAKNRMLSLYFSGVAWIKDTLESLKVGTPRITLEIAQAAQMFVLNSAVLRILGIDAMEIYAICTNTLIMAELLAGGIISVIPNICGVLFGEKDYFAIRRLMRKVVTLSGALIAVLTVVFLLFPEEIAQMFGQNDESQMEATALCLQIYSLSFVPFVFNEFLQVYYQTILETMLATLDTILEFFVLLIPTTFLLMKYWGIYGVCAAVPISEILTIFIVEALRKVYQDRGKLPQEGLLMIPKPEHDDSLDLTIEASEANAAGLSEKVMEYLRERGVEERKAYVMGLSAEEMAVNISRYGYATETKRYIDINLSKAIEEEPRAQDEESEEEFKPVGEWILRIRDDGVPFDPTQYLPEEEAQYEHVGIKLVRAMALKVTYTRVLNMNNTIIEV